LNQLLRRAVEHRVMKKQPTRLENTLRMRAWRDRKGGLKPPIPPRDPSVLEHWLEKWRQSMPVAIRRDAKAPVLDKGKRAV